MNKLLAILAPLLPPYNLARLFSYVRHLEQQLAQPCPVCEMKDALIEDLRAELRVRENYALNRINAPSMHVEPRAARATVIGRRKSLRKLKASAQAEALLKSLERGENQPVEMADDQTQAETMAERADRFAAEVNQNRCQPHRQNR